MKANNNTKFISLKKASQVSGYSPDYIGFLIRNGELNGKKVYKNISWQISLISTIQYLKKHHSSNSKDWKLLFTFKDKYISLKKASHILGYSSDYLGSLIRSGEIKGKKVYLTSSWITTKKALVEYKKTKGRKIEKNKTKGEIVWFEKEKLFLKKTQDNLIFLRNKTKRELTYFNNIYNNRKAFVAALNETFKVSLISIIVFSLILSVSPMVFLQSSIGTIFAEEEKIINFYSSVSIGDWQNPENVQGLPEVGPLGTIDSFSESNSATYESGPLSSVVENFQSDFNTDQLNEKQIKFAKIKFSFAIGERKADVLIQQQEANDEEEMGTDVGQIGFWDKVKNFFKTLAVKTINLVRTSLKSLTKMVFIVRAEEGAEVAEEIIEEGQETNRQETSEVEVAAEGAEVDEEVEETEGQDPGNEVQDINKEAEEENEGDGEVAGNMNGEGEEQTGEEQEKQVSEEEEEPTTEESTTVTEETTTTEIEITDAISTGTASSNATGTEEVGAEDEINTDATSTESTTINEATTTDKDISEDTLPNVDAKIIIWYSLNSQGWQELDTIFDYPLSNALNNGYFEYDAYFLENWEDIKNLKIKFEGAVGGETNITVYLDSVWVEVDYHETDIGGDEGAQEEQHVAESPISEEDENIPLEEMSEEITEEDIEEDEEKSVEEETGEEEAEGKITEEEILEEEQDEELEEELEERQGEIELRSKKKDFQSREEPRFRFKYKYKNTPDVYPDWSKVNVKTKLKNPERELIDIYPDFNFESNGEISFGLSKPRAFKPGLYKLIFIIEENGQIQKFEQTFTWGVLAININKSIYLQNETAYLQMAVLDDKGHTICDAELKLEITTPNFQTTVLSTQDGTIQLSGQCGPDNVIDVPDYFAHYQVGELGIYRMKLINLDKGYQIDDSFEVREWVPFDIERVGPTRIYPPAIYVMKIKIKVNQDFIGQVVESVPESFEIIEASQSRMSIQSDTKEIIWDVDWKTGEIYELKYYFDALDISPYLYLLGPLRFEQ